MTAPNPKLNDWIEYKRLVLAELERLDEYCKKIQKEQEEIVSKISTITARCSYVCPISAPEAKWKFYAAIATVIGTAITAIISLIISLYADKLL